MKPFAFNVIYWWVILWVLYSFWYSAFTNPFGLLVMGLVAIFIVSVITIIGAPDLLLWDEEEEPFREDRDEF